MKSIKIATLTALAAAALACLTAGVRAQDAKDPEPKAGKAVLTAGYRGVSLALAASQLAFVKKGDRVDVLVTFDAEMADKKKEKVTATILQNVVVLEVRMPAKLDERGAVELLVNPNEAQYAALGVFQGELSLLRRAEGDVKMTPMEMASFRKLFR
jgi:Flp pilus assembly protein CpaB